MDIIYYRGDEIRNIYAENKTEAIIWIKENLCHKACLIEDVFSGAFMICKSNKHIEKAVTLFFEKNQSLVIHPINIREYKFIKSLKKYEL